MTAGEKFINRILPVTSPSFQLILGESQLHRIRPDLKMSQIHGHPFVPALVGKAARPNPYLRLPVYLPTHDPDEALKNPKLLKELRADALTFAQIMAVRDHLTYWPRVCVKCPNEGWKQPVDLLTYCERHFPPLGRRIPIPAYKKALQQGIL